MIYRSPIFLCPTRYFIFSYRRVSSLLNLPRHCIGGARVTRAGDLYILLLVLQRPLREANQTCTVKLGRCRWLISNQLIGVEVHTRHSVAFTHLVQRPSAIAAHRADHELSQHGAGLHLILFPPLLLLRWREIQPLHRLLLLLLAHSALLPSHGL